MTSSWSMLNQRWNFLKIKITFEWKYINSHLRNEGLFLLVPSRVPWEFHRRWCACRQRESAGWWPAPPPCASTTMTKPSPCFKLQSFVAKEFYRQWMNLGQWYFDDIFHLPSHCSSSWVFPSGWFASLWSGSHLSPAQPPAQFNLHLNWHICIL